MSEEMSSSSSEKMVVEEVLVTPAIIQGPFINTASLHPTPPATTIIEPEKLKEGGAEIILEKVESLEGKEWAKERIERRLRGEYERAGTQLSELVNDNLETPLRLNAIRILGAKTTRTSFLSTLIAPSLPILPPATYLSSSLSSLSPSASKPQTLRNLLSTTRELTNLLEEFDIFKSIEASLESTPGYLAEAGDVDIVLKVKETGKYMIKTSTDVGDGEGTASATVRIRNAFGGAETIEGNVATGTRTKSAFQLKIDTPVNGSPITKADLSIYASQRDLNYFASCNEGSQGATARLRTKRGAGYHEIAYDAVLRRIWNVAPAASLSIRDAAGPSVKSSLSYTFIRDTRDSPFIPTAGSYVRYKQEYAGLGGDANFVKGEIETSASRSIADGYILSLGLKSGLLFPFGSKPSLFSDRFHLGGPTSVRMFRPSTMGPKDSGDYLGGDLHWAAGMSLLTPFPGKPTWPLKPHFFLNAGRLIGGNDLSLASKFKSLVSEPSLTAGVGFVYAHSIVRVEASLGVPLAMGKQEGGVKGFQFGLGISFL